MKNMAGREEVLKIFPKDLRTILGQVTVDFDRVQELKQMAVWRLGFPTRR